MNGNLHELPEKVAAGDEFEVQLAPLGAYPQFVDGKQVMQVVDGEAAEQLIKNFKDEVLVDCDHNSEEGRGTEAQAWVKNVRIDPERGIVGTFKFTDKGAEAVSNRRFRYVSPAWTLDDNNRPKELVSVALTNKPNLPVSPVLNMKKCCNAEGENGEPENPGLTETGNSESSEEVNDNNNNPGELTTGETKGNPNMDKLKEMLGLPPETSDDDVVAAVDALVQTLGKMKEAAKNAEAERFAEENADVVENADELKEQYLADPEGTQKVVANCRKMLEKAVANAKAEATKAAQTVVAKNRVTDSAKAVEPVILNHRTALNSCKTAEEQNAYLLAHRGEMG